MESERHERVLEIGRSLVTELDLDTLLARILDVARELTGARYAAVGLVDAATRGLTEFATAGVDAATAAQIGERPQGRGVLGALTGASSPLRLDCIGDHPRSYGFPVGHPPMTTFLGVPIRGDDGPWANLYLTDKPGGFTADDEAAVVTLADWAATAIANARRYEAEHRRRDALERDIAGHHARVEISRALAGETDLDRVLELVVKRGRAIIGARTVFVELIEADEAVIAAAAGDDAAVLQRRRLPLSRSLAGRLAHTHTPLRIDTLTDDDGGLQRLPGLGATAGLFAPLRLRGRLIGALGALDRIDDGPTFIDPDMAAIESIASSAANAIATARVVADATLRRGLNAAEEERRRWARELHDETLQDIAGVRVLLGASRNGPPELVAEAVDDAIAQLADSIDGLRGLITDLHPAALDRLGIEPALTALVDRVRQRTDLAVTFRLDLAAPDGRLPQELEHATYRTVQEALRNVTQHADAEVVDVSVVARDDTIDIEVRDDGRGFVANDENAGFGLLGMRERLATVGGELRIRSTPGAGTSVLATVPVTGPTTGNGLPTTTGPPPRRTPAA